ncbi:MAG: hypothetical protein JWN34_4458 [Bryobacterales bacterium]|nr:hypothetical protein [Bryobacterales bacterium]
MVYANPYNWPRGVGAGADAQEPKRAERYSGSCYAGD